MKKIIAGALVLLIFCTLCGCAVIPKTTTGFSIVTTVFPPYDFVRNIIGETADISVVQLLRPGTESHTFDPTPADILRVERCDLFLYVGGESDAWVETLLAAVDNPHMTVLKLMDLLEDAVLVEEMPVEGMTVHGHDHTHDHEIDSDVVEYDEHIWTSPKNASILCRAIADVLCTLDAANADDYRTNCTAYLAELDALDRRFAAITQAASQKLIVFGDRFPFRYLCDAYGLSYRAAFPGCAAESEPSARTMAYLIETVKEKDISVIFQIEMSGGKIAKTIAEETDAVVLTMHSCHNRTAEEAEVDKSYLDLMTANADALQTALEVQLSSQDHIFYENEEK